MRRGKKHAVSSTLKMHPGCKDRIDPHELDLEQGRSAEQGSRLLQGSKGVGKTPCKRGRLATAPKSEQLQMEVQKLGDEKQLKRGQKSSLLVGSGGRGPF